MTTIYLLTPRRCMHRSQNEPYHEIAHTQLPHIRWFNHYSQTKIFSSVFRIQNLHRSEKLERCKKYHSDVLESVRFGIFRFSIPWENCQNLGQNYSLKDTKGIRSQKNRPSSPHKIRRGVDARTFIFFLNYLTLLAVSLSFSFTVLLLANNIQNPPTPNQMFSKTNKIKAIFFIQNQKYNI